MQKPARNTFGLPQDPGKLASLAEARQAAPKMESAPSRIDVSAALRKRPYLGLVIFALVIFAGAPAVMKPRAKEYRAEATIYVSPTVLKNLQGDRDTIQISYETLVNQQIMTIRRYDVLSESLKRLQKAGIRWSEPDETEAAAVDRLAKALDVLHIPDSYEILVALNGPNREALAPVVNTIANVFVEKQKGEDQAAHAVRMAALRSAQGHIDAQLQQKLQQQADLSEKALVASLDKAGPAQDNLLSASRTALVEVRRKRMEAEMQVATLTAASQAGGSALTALAEESVANDYNTRMLTNSLLQRSLELRARMEGLTPEHPVRQETEKELAAINEQLVQIPKNEVDAASARLLLKLQAEVARTRLLESQLEQQVTADTSTVLDIAKKAQAAQGLSADIERLRRSQAAVTSEMDDLALKNSPLAYTRIFSSALAPLTPVKSSQKKTAELAAALVFLALLAAALVCIAADLVDQRIRSPFDVKRAVGFPPVGFLLDPGPDRFAEDHFWRLVNAIRRGIALQDAKCIVVTPLSGESTPGEMVADVGRALVSSGLRTVIVDANRCREDERSWRGVAQLPSLDEPLAPADRNCRTGSLPRIEINSPRELSRIPVSARVGRASAMLDELKREYDVVLVDAPPLLLSADTQFLGEVADITLLVVEAGAATRGELTMAAGLLRRIGAPGMGIVMSKVRLRDAGKDLKEDFKRFHSRSLTPTLTDVKV
jgi:succinoglycan biosynthesis transport protein ExoP